MEQLKFFQQNESFCTDCFTIILLQLLIITIIIIKTKIKNGLPGKRCVKARSLASSCVRASVCYLNEDVQHIRICHFVFPKFLDIEWCNLHGGCRERKDSEENNIVGTLSSLSVCAGMHRRVWYFCKCVGKAIVCLPGELHNSSRFPRNPTAWALTCLRPHQRLK